MFPDDDTDEAANDCAGHEIGEPMDGHGDAEADVEGVGHGQPAQPAVFGKQGEDGGGHGKGNGGVRGRPAPEDSAAQEAELEPVAEVGAEIMKGRVHAAGKGLVGGGDQRAEESGLADGPAKPADPWAAGDKAGEDQCQRQQEWNETADGGRGNHPLAENGAAGGGEIKPVESGLDEQECEEDGQEVPENRPALEAQQEMAGQGGEKLFHMRRSIRQIIALA